MSVTGRQTLTSPTAGDGGPAAGTDLDPAVEIFLSHRTRLFRVAYRVVGDVAGAEDVVQEAWLRWQRTDRSTIRNPAAFLTTTTTHLAINVIQSARHRHEAPTESPLSDLVDPADDPAHRAEQSAAVEEILVLLMQRLSPGELAAYVLRKGFDYPYVAIAGLLRTSVPNVRQLVRRSQQHLEGDRERAFDADAYRHITTAFLRAARSGDLASWNGCWPATLARPMRAPGSRPLGRRLAITACHCRVPGDSNRLQLGPFHRGPVDVSGYYAVFGPPETRPDQAVLHDRTPRPAPEGRPGRRAARARTRGGTTPDARPTHPGRPQRRPGPQRRGRRRQDGVAGSHRGPGRCRRPRRADGCLRERDGSALRRPAPPVRQADDRRRRPSNPTVGSPGDRVRPARLRRTESAGGQSGSARPPPARRR